MELTKDKNTEDKIKEIAKKIFAQKGFAATTIRDIALEAGVNVALLNYYFRSKENLFNIIFVDSFVLVFEKEQQILEDKELALFEKINLFIANKIAFLKDNPALPLFVLSEMREATAIDQLKKRGFDEAFFQNKVFEQQLKKAIHKNKIREISVQELKIYIISLIVFPFLAKDMIINMSKLAKSEASFSFENYIATHQKRVQETVYLYLKNI